MGTVGAEEWNRQFYLGVGEEKGIFPIKGVFSVKPFSSRNGTELIRKQMGGGN